MIRLLKCSVPFIFPLGVFALPLLPEIVSGQLECTLQSPEVLELMVSDQAIINWQSFSVDLNETARFIQPHSEASVINRVTSQTPSEIMGRLESNGKVILINPNGILVGKESQIDCGSLIASTLDIHEKSFLDTGSFDFSGLKGGSIRFEGAARGEDIFLIAPNVSLTGQLDARGNAGIIGTSATNESYSISTNFDLFLEPPTFTYSSGQIYAKNIYIYADYIHLDDHAILSASGALQGGKIYLQNASRILVSSDAILNASATLRGDGGKIVTLAKEANAFYGTVLAEGGAESGNGGFIEISAPWLDYQGVVSTKAFNGKTGDLLLDPLDITISPSITTGFVSAGPFFQPTGGLCGPGTGATFANLSQASIIAALGSSNVTVSTVGTMGVCDGDITVAAATDITWANANTLTLEAANDINFPGPGTATIDCMSSGSVILNAVGSIFISNGRVRNTGPVGGAGDVILIANDTITIQANTAFNALANAGSQNGNTFVGDPNLPRCNRSRPDVIVETLPTAFGRANLGFLFPALGGGAGQEATGPIDVTCDHLQVVARQSTSWAVVGHGVNSNSQLSTTDSATITVDASSPDTAPLSAIQLLCTSNPNTSQAIIGHTASTMSATLAGNICVTCNGDIELNTNVLALVGASRSIIGHIQSQPGQSIGTQRGDISVVSNQGSIRLISGPLSSYRAIGHYSGGTQTTSVVGNIFVSAAIDLICSATTISGGVDIGHHNTNGNTIVIPSVTSNIQINVGRDFIFTSPENEINRIGSNATTFNNTGAINLFVARDLSITYSGNNSMTIGNTPLGSTTAPTNIAVGGNASFFETGVSGAIRIQSPADVNFAAVGNILVSTTTPTITISTLSTGGFTTRIYSGGNITSIGTAFLGSTSAASMLASSVDIRALNGISMSRGFTASTGGAILSSPTVFAAGELLTTTSQGLTRVAGQNVPILGFPTCTNSAQGGCGCCPVFAFTSALSPATSINGAVCAVTPPISGQTITTTSGPIQILGPNPPYPIALPVCGACLPCSDLTIGPVPANNIAIATTSGAITVRSFNDIDINQNITTSNNVDIEACNDLTINNRITTSASGNISLLAGHDLIIGGLNPTVTSSAGSICLFAINDIYFNQNVTSTSGFISAIAAQNIIMNSANVTTSGTILFQSGLDILMLGTSTITSTASPVALIVDANHAFAPFTGLPPPVGAITMEAGTSINSGPGQALSIYTALQSSNMIDPAALLNGSTFTPTAALYTDTDSEVWCTFAPAILSCSSNGCGAFIPSLFPGIPFTISYKICLQQVTEQATVIVTQLLYDLTPFSAFPGWMERFMLIYDPEYFAPNEPYFLRRRAYRILNQPKSSTALESVSADFP